MLKKQLLIGAAILSGILLSPEIINAAEYKETPKVKMVRPTTKEAQIDQLFENMKDTDKIIVTPEGDFISGRVTIQSGIEFGRSVKVYNSETDPSAKTVLDLKEELQNGNSDILSDSYVSKTSRLPTSPGIITLDAGGYYSSNKFSGSGWRYGGYLFCPAEGTGKYLRWRTYVDDGRVGSLNETNSSVGGNPKGMPLYVSSGFTYYAPPEFSSPIWANYPAMYCTYNPISGTYYRVENV